MYVVVPVACGVVAVPCGPVGAERVVVVIACGGLAVAYGVVAFSHVAVSLAFVALPVARLAISFPSRVVYWRCPVSKQSFRWL